VNVPPAVLKAIHGVPLRNIVDWPSSERDGYVMRPVNTVVNAFHYRALILMQQIAAALERSADAAQLGEAAQVTYASVNAKLFDTATGLYIDGEGATHSALHANMFPLAFGLIPAERMPPVAAFVRGRGMACSVYGAQYLLEACYASGMADYALELLTATSKRSWMHMINDVGTTMTLEAWDDSVKPNEDWNHAWGAAPANIIPRLLMGIEPIEPGFRKVRLRPQPGPLADARITVPTIRGPIQAAIRQENNVFTLHTSLPANMEGEVWLPTSGKVQKTVSVNGKKASGRTIGNFIVIDQIGSGENVIAMQ
jgi:alpha-L-rhamnosidase